MKRYLICLMAFVIVFAQKAEAQIEREKKSKQKLKEMSGTFLPKDAIWFNSKRPFSTSQFDEERLILHFWNPLKAEGWETMRAVKDLHIKYPSAVALTVLPSTTELYRDSTVVNELITKFGINHPLIYINDYSTFNFADSVAIQQTPVVYLVDADGRTTGGVKANGMVDMEKALQAFFPNEGRPASGIYKYSLTEKSSGVLNVLNNPADVAEDPVTGNLFVADAGSHRVLEISPDGRVERAYGSGIPGLQDGKYGGTRFNSPKGLAFDPESGLLYVADTYNHVIRSIDPETGVVKTVLGNGTLNQQFQLFVDSTENGLNYPADVAFTRGRLMIAMAGANQIWQYNPQNGKGRAAIGNGKPASVDGGTGVAALHSPQHLVAGNNGDLFVADVGSGKVRKVAQTGMMTTINIDPEILGEYGSVAGLAYGNEELFLSDYIGNRILKWTEEKGVEVLSGSGANGKEDGSAAKSRFYRPAGLVYTDGDLIVVDEYNGALRKVNPKRGKTKSIRLYNFYDLFRTVEAYSVGHQVIFDELILKKGTNSVYVEMILDEPYKWETAGRNAITMELPGENRLLNFDPTRGFIELEVNGSETNNIATVQVYATVRNRETDEVTFRAFLLLFPLVFEPEIGERQHDIVWRPFRDL